MSVDDRVLKRIKALIEEADSFPSEFTYDDYRAGAWVLSASQCVATLCGGSPSRYVEHVEQIRNQDMLDNPKVEMIRPILITLMKDLESGLLQTVADRARAETFDDFLQLAEHCLEEGKLRHAGVLVSAVFEDGVKRVCQKHDIEPRKKLDSSIDALKTAGVLKKNKMKGAKRAADLRNAAMHADWEAFDGEGVGASIEFTKHWIGEELGESPL